MENHGLQPGYLAAVELLETVFCFCYPRALNNLTLEMYLM